MSTQGFDDKRGWWFAGNGSFISNGYVIYSNGLDGHDPNPLALKSASKFAMNYIDKRKEPFQEFISLLRLAASRAELNEK